MRADHGVCIEGVSRGADTPWTQRHTPPEPRGTHPTAHRLTPPGPRGTETNPSPSTEGITDPCENITYAQTSFAGGKN